MRPLAAGVWMLIAASAAGAAIWLTTAWLLGVAADAPPQERAKIRIDAVRTGLAAGAGVGAAVGLMLAFRRQQHQEIATALSDHDAAERRVTDLYNAAAEQLGSGKAPVRLTALYTLERLANDNPAHRQTIVNIICAYLRMPYTPPSNGIDPDEDRRQAARRYRAARTGSALPLPQEETGQHEEHQVRLTAQRILETHLRRDATTHWADVLLDLTGAALTDFQMHRCSLDYARFDGATFSGGTFIIDTTFSGISTFAGATFTDHVTFYDVTFVSAIFSGVTFRSAGFTKTTVSDGAIFAGATFTDHVSFRDVTFSRSADFEGALFPDSPDLEGVCFESEEVTPPPGWQVEVGQGRARRLVPDGQAEDDHR